MSHNVLGPQFPRYAAPAEFHTKVEALLPQIGESRMTDSEASRQWALRHRDAKEKHAQA